MTSPLQKMREEYKPPVPKILQNLLQVEFTKGEATHCLSDEEEIKPLFSKTFGQPMATGKKGDLRKPKPLRVGVVLSGGQAAGGHNVISGLFDALQTFSAESALIGFLGGPSGIVDNQAIEITAEVVAPYRNQGGFDLIGSGRTKIETDEQLAASLNTAKTLKLDGLVVIGGDDSNTNAAVLAEYFQKNGCDTTVVGVPKTIDGDLKNSHIATSFGFDTAAKVYSEMIGNIARDALSAKKYYHFIKLMGRSASHITLECALATHPNSAIIGEEVAAHALTLSQITDLLADLVIERAEKGMNYGVFLVPEGLVEFIPEMKELIKELNALAERSKEMNQEQIAEELTAEARHCFLALPEEIRKQLLLDRDPHGNVQVSMIETEKLLISSVKKELDRRSFRGKFSAQSHFFGYEGRAGFPSNFDAHYCYALGQTAALLIDEGLTAYMTVVGNLSSPVESWSIGGLPITSLLNMEVRKGKKKPVIQKALVDLEGKPFQFFAKHRKKWGLEDDYRFPGPIQFYGKPEVTDAISLTLDFEK